MDDVDLYVCESSSPEEGKKTCVSLLCGTWDGSTYRVWGARTHPEYRGKGIMKYMMTMLYTKVAAENVQYLISTTILENATMRNIFKSLGYGEHAVVYGWPDSKHAHHIDELMNDTEYIQSTRLEYWEVCSNAHVLCDALSTIRGGQGVDRVWLPGSYETVSADGETIQRMMEQERVYIAYNATDVAVAVVARLEDQLDQQILSIVHAQVACTLDMLHEYRMSTKDTIDTIKRIYMDTCGGGAPSDSKLTLGLFEYIVLCKQT